MGFVKGLRCKECGKDYDKLPIHVCEYCFGPLEVDYDYTGIGKVVSRKSIQDGPPSMWRYKEFMPIDEEPKVGLHTGFTPLVRAKNLAKALNKADAIVLYGPAGTNIQFKKRLDAAYPQIASRVRDVLTADSMTEGQMQALIRDYFENN